MQQPVYIVDIIGAIVSKVSTAVTPTLQEVNNTITGVHYLYGHHQDIKKRLIEKGNSRTKKFDRYPLIALFLDIPESYKANGSITVKLQLIIGYHSDINYYTDDRIIKVIKPIVNPIYEELKTQIANSTFFYNTPTVDSIVHEKIIRPNWGNPSTYGTQDYIFSDVLDAIEVRALELTINPKNCLNIPTAIQSFN